MDELSFAGAIPKPSPRRRKQHSIACSSLHCLHLACDLIRGQKVVSIEPLDKIALSARKQVVPCRSRTLVSLRNDRNLLRSKCARNAERTVPRSIIYNNDLFVGPGLVQSRLDCLGNPLLRVISRDEDRD